MTVALATIAVLWMRLGIRNKPTDRSTSAEQAQNRRRGPAVMGKQIDNSESEFEVPIPSTIAATSYVTKFPDVVIQANRIRINTELANAELALDNSVPFDIHFSFKNVAGACIMRFKFPVEHQPSEEQFMRLVRAGGVLNTEQARISYKYSEGFYQSVCDAVGPVTAKKLSEMLKRKKDQRGAIEDIPLPEMPTLLHTVLESSSISEVSYGFANMSTLLAVKPVSYIPLWQQPFMRTGNAMPSRADRASSATLELIGVIFYCKSRPDECTSGTYFTVLQCRSYYICAPGLDTNAYLAMQYSQQRITAANQIADALIEQRRLRLASRPGR